MFIREEMVRGRTQRTDEGDNRVTNTKELHSILSAFRSQRYQFGCRTVAMKQAPIMAISISPAACTVQLTVLFSETAKNEHASIHAKTKKDSHCNNA
jgi:hypothetical protein